MSRGDKAHFALGLAGCALLMLLLACTPGISFTEDLGRHLLLGKIILAERAVPQTNLLTYTHPEFPFINHHWLSEIFLYLAHRAAGLNGLIAWKMIMMTLGLLCAMLARKPRGEFNLYWLAGIFSAVILGFRAHIRPELFTYLNVALLMLLLDQIRKGNCWPSYAVPPLMLLWANAHIYFIFGLGMLFLFLIERLIGSEPQKRVRETGWFALAVLFSAANPNFLKGLLYPFAIFRNYGVAITENASPLEYWHTVLNPMLIALPLLSLLFFIALGRLVIARIRTRDASSEGLAEIFTALAAFAAACLMARSAPLFALTALPVIAAAPSRTRRWAAAPLLILNILLCAAVVEGKYARIFPSPIGPTPFGFDDESRYQRLTALARDYGLKGPVFTDYNIGSLVEYQLWPEPGYVDNRPEAFPAAFWRTEYEPALALGPAWEEISARRGFNAIIVSLTGVKEAFCRELMRRPEWVLVHLDEFCGMWVRNDISNKQIIDASIFNEARLGEYVQDLGRRIGQLPEISAWRRQIEADVIVYRLYSLICVDATPAVWPMLKKVHLMYPDWQIVHELMRVSVPPEDIQMAEQVLAEKARWPLAAKQVLDWGHVLLARKEIAEAQRVFRRGRFFFPLSPALREALRICDDLEYVTAPKNN